ncbi:MAG: RNA methyltransferase [Lachnospiraceae bacterium]|nr:RNA methyltransferase [Lachnospiraceae bacterium]
MITSTANQQMKRVIQLNKKAKTRYEQRVFVVEGMKLCMEAPKEEIAAMYVSESFLEEEDKRKKIQGYSYEVVSDHVFQTISDTKTPQGILSLVKMPEYHLEDLMGKNPHLLILESIQDPGNLGTMIRTGEGAGITGIIMNQTTVDVYHPKTIRAAMGALYRVPFYIAKDLQETIEYLKEKGIFLYGAHLEGNLSYDQPDYTRATGFLIGNEGNGLSAQTAELADTWIQIPMEGQVESLNAAVAAALLMYEVRRQRK